MHIHLLFHQNHYEIVLNHFQLNFIYQQITVDDNFNEFMRIYNTLGYRNKLIIECVEGEIRID